MKGEIWRRSPRLLSAVLGEVRDRDEGIDLGDLLTVVEGAGEWTRKTISNAVADLESFGAVRKTGKPGTTWVEMTVLGEAWLQDEKLPMARVPSELREAIEGLFS